ncbi:hypothetical protein BH24BAC1_BH24BAC1_24790 [soil metagenome]|jgi:hypothetical protein
MALTLESSNQDFIALDPANPFILRILIQTTLLLLQPPVPQILG